MQEKQKKAIRWISPVLIALTALIVWRVNYEIEFMMDDEWYSTVLYADTPIRNLSDIIHAQIWHYFNWGGRSMAHALLQLILLAGEHWADILNTGMTLLLGWLACMIADRRKLPYWFAALGMILGLNANWKMSMFWEAGAANYLYMAGFLLAFLFCYLKYEEKNLPGIVIWILPLGLIAGWSNENMGPAVWLLSLLVILLRHREHKKAPVWMYLGNISCLAGVMEYLFPALLLTVFALIVCKGILKENLGRNTVLLLLGALLSWGAMILSPHYPDRAAFGTMVLLICAILSMAGKIADRQKENVWMFYGCAVLIWLRGMYFLVEYLGLCWGWIKQVNKCPL